MSTLRPDIQWELELASGGTSTARGTAAAKAAHTGRGLTVLAIACLVPRGDTGAARWHARDSSLSVPTAPAAPAAQPRYAIRPFEIVISHYQEEPAWVHDTITRYREILRVNHSTEAYVIVLTKNLDPATVQAQLTLNCTDTDEHGCANETVSLRNIGRETESFLWFIAQRYDSVAEYTLFTQAAPLAAAWAVNRLQNVLRVEGGARTGFLPLAQTNVTQCGGDFWSRSVVNREVYTMLTGTLCDETQPYFVAFRSEFVVSRARLRAQPLNTYQKLHSYVAAPDGHWLHDNSTFEGPPILGEGASRPFFGYTLERNWALMFNCSDARTRESCCDQKDMVNTPACRGKTMRPGDCSCMDTAAEAE